jgi:hypothetical protein
VMCPHEQVPFVRGVAFLDAGDPRCLGQTASNSSSRSPGTGVRSPRKKAPHRNQSNRPMSASNGAAMLTAFWQPLPENAHAAKGNSGASHLRQPARATVRRS